MIVYPWDGWYHCMGNTYGTWLRGDERGWRSRHHCEHVEGDYKHRPAPGSYDQELRQSKDAMTREPVVLSMQHRAIVCQALVEKLLRDDAKVAAAVVAAKHFHIVVRFPNWQSPGMAMPGLSPHNVARRGAAMIDPAPRHFIGRAKKHSSHTLREHHLDVPGGVWAVRSEIKPVESETHYRFLVDNYLPDHATKQGGVLWKP